MRLLAVFAAILAAGASGARAESDGTPRPEAPPNYVFIMSDDLGWGDTGYAGNPLVKTPHLDAMAEAGLRFDRFYTTTPSSTPPRFAALTGVYPERWKGEGMWTIPEPFTTLAEALQGASYKTGLFGKWALGKLDPAEDFRRWKRHEPEYYIYNLPSQHGFEVFFATMGDVPLYNPAITPGNYRKGDLKPGDPYPDRYWTEAGKPATRNLEGPNPRVIMDRVEPFIRQAVGARKPFLATIWFHTPHEPVVASPEHRAIYPDMDEKGQHYLGAITAMDEQIGRLRTVLEEVGADENTLILFCSDNGPRGKRDHINNGATGMLLGRKDTLYEGGIRVPALAVWPAVIEPGQTCDIPVSLLDVMPTLLEAAGAAWPNTQPRDGESFLPLLRGESWLRQAPLYFLFEQHRAVVTASHKLLSTNSGRSWTLYNLNDLPPERPSGAVDAPPRTEHLLGLFEQWREEMERMPIPESG